MKGFNTLCVKWTYVDGGFIQVEFESSVGIVPTKASPRYLVTFCTPSFPSLLFFFSLTQWFDKKKDERKK